MSNGAVAQEYACACKALPSLGVWEQAASGKLCQLYTGAVLQI